VKPTVPLVLAVSLGVASASASLQTPAAVRNQRPLPGTEVLVLRHQQLAKGAHDAYYRASMEGVWPWYEKIGTRVVGQWMVIDPDGGPGDPTADHAYRLARYASVAHWRATRDPANVRLGGDGLDRAQSLQSGRDRTGVQTGSKGAYFLQGVTATTRPLYMPGVEESLERQDGVASATDPVIAMRSAAAQPAAEIVELRYQQIAKGRFDEFAAHTRDAVWPWEEKLGARPLGQWRVIYPDAPSRTKERQDADEVITMTRYASLAHLAAMAPDRAVLLGGNGPDWRAWRTALDAQRALTRATSVEVLRGALYGSPPIYTPSLGERYRTAP
jgi:hypothetical protein